MATIGCVATEPGIGDQAIEYDLVGSFDTVYSTFHDPYNVYTSTTKTTPTPVSGVLHFTAMQPVPSGKLTVTDDRETRDWVSSQPTARSGEDVTLVFAYFDFPTPNPKWVLTGKIAGDSIYGAIRHESSTSTTYKAWGHFVARRRR